MTGWRDKPTTLYRFFDSDSRLLYVGITCRGPERWADHASEKGWWTDVARVTADHFPNRAAAAAAEVVAIRLESPSFNWMHSDMRRRHVGPALSNLPAELVDSIRSAVHRVSDAEATLAAAIEVRDDLIWQASRLGSTTRELAPLLGVSHGTIHNLVRRRERRQVS